MSLIPYICGVGHPPKVDRLAMFVHGTLQGISLAFDLDVGLDPP